VKKNYCKFPEREGERFCPGSYKFSRTKDKGEERSEPEKETRRFGIREEKEQEVECKSRNLFSLKKWEKGVGGWGTMSVRW